MSASPSTLLLSAALASSLLACGQNPGGPATSSGNFSLSAGSAELSFSVGDSAPASGNEFVLVTVTLENSGVAAPISTAFTNYSLVTDSAVVYSASAASAEAASACAAGVSVADGGQLSCSVVFEVPVNTVPSRIDYAWGALTASAPVALPAVDVTLEGTVTSADGGTLSFPVATATNWYAYSGPDCGSAKLPEALLAVHVIDSAPACGEPLDVPGTRVFYVQAQATAPSATSAQPVLAPGTFPIQGSGAMAGTDARGDSLTGLVSFYVTDANNVARGAIATGGSVVINSISATTVTGSFSATFVSEYGGTGTLSGTFSSPVCNASLSYEQFCG